MLSMKSTKSCIAPVGLLAWLMAWAAAVPAQSRSALGPTATEAREQNPFRLEGTIRGPHGGAQGVQVHVDLRDMRERRPFTTLTSRTDAEGRYTFDLSRYDIPEFGMEVYTTSPRFIRQSQILRRSRLDLPALLDFTLQPGAIARGVVVDGDGNPLEDVLAGGNNLQTQRSNREGEWEVFGLPMGPSEILFTKEGYAEVVLTVSATEPTILDGYRVEMQSARALRGAVVDRAGNGVARATVRFLQAGRFRTERGDRDGRFEFVGVPEELAGSVLEVAAPGFLPGRRELTPAEEESLEARVVVDNGVWLAGHASLASGDGAAGAIVRLGRGERDVGPQALVASDGSWRLGPLPPGQDVVLTVLPPASEASWAIGTLFLNPPDASGAHAGRVELWPKGFSSTFTATVADGTLTMRRVDDGPGGLAGEVVYTAPWDGAATEAEGTLRVPALEQEGTFRMVQRVKVGEGLGGQWDLREELGPSLLNAAPVQRRLSTGVLLGERVLELALPAGRVLQGQALREDGSPFIDGRAVLYGWNNTGVFSRMAPIRAAGRFTIDRVPEGFFFLVARSEDGEDFTEPAVFSSDAMEVVLRAGAPEPDPMED